MRIVLFERYDGPPPHTKILVPFDHFSNLQSLSKSRLCFLRIHGSLRIKIHKTRFSKQNQIKCYLHSSLKLVTLDALIYISCTNIPNVNIKWNIVLILRLILVLVTSTCIFHLKQFSTKSTIFVEIYFMIWRNDTFWLFNCV